MNDEELLQLSMVRNLINRASTGTLPWNFDQWDLADENGWSVAHEAAAFSNLPKDFNQWDLISKKGWTVAQIAALWGSLPKDFHINYPEHWNSVGPTDKSVESIAIGNGYKV